MFLAIKDEVAWICMLFKATSFSYQLLQTAKLNETPAT